MALGGDFFEVSWVGGTSALEADLVHTISSSRMKAANAHSLLGRTHTRPFDLGGLYR
jgi:hypothetical protein